MKRNKGFTLVELLAVIAILAILAGIATPIVLTVRNNIKGKMFDTKVKEIKAMAVLCAEQKCNGSSECVECDTPEDLCREKFLKPEQGLTESQCLLNPVNNLPMNTCHIKLEYVNKRWKATFDGKEWNGSNWVTRDHCKKD